MDFKVPDFAKGVVFTIFVVFWMLIFASAKSEKQYEIGNKIAEASLISKFEDWVLDIKVSDLMLIGFTAVLAWKTAGLDVSTRALWKAGDEQRALSEKIASEQYKQMNESIIAGRDAAISSRRSADAAESALLAVQRAHVSMGMIIYEDMANILTDQIEECVVWFPWINTGQTPCYNATSQCNMMLVRYMPEWFPFDYEKDIPITSFFIAPGATKQIGPMRIGWDAITQVLERKKRLFFYGWIKYDDAFGNAHLSRFCTELVNIVFPRDEIVSKPKIFFSDWVRFNCIDDQCDRDSAAASLLKPANWQDDESRM